VLACHVHAADYTAPCVVLTLKAEAVVAGPALTLGDITESRGGVVAPLDKLALMTAPRIGNVEHMTAEDVERVIRSHRRPTDCPVAVEGAPSVSIRRASQWVGPQSLLSAAREQVLRDWKGRAEQLETTPAADVVGVNVPVGAISLQAHPTESALLPSRLLVRVDIVVDGVFARSVMLPFSVHATRRVLVARRKLLAGSVANLEDLAVSTETVSGLRAVPMNVADAHMPLRLRKSLERGQILLEEDVADAGGVLRGDRVRLLFGEGSVKVETVAIAQSDAHMGQLVSVKPLNGDDVVEGRLIEHDVVQAD
jgi:flagella basal body P-ring formation protein FlgA